ncbi:hypothetical protein CGMCC3_g3243 [Colletotrichum fructicola]|nr:uncharacterized protein CGMCC3_g3243 [Colletotrichum fructicola]KAE9581123.1 hypothetical protein CGMCC3_g3243 [Colletotrichum fructicola]KAF5514419.1 Ubiquitin-like protein SMT3 [Colletotrichum fructicola]
MSRNFLISYRHPSTLRPNFQASTVSSRRTQLSHPRLSQAHTMSGEHENGSPAAGGQEAPPAVEHLNIKVTDNNNEVFFKIKRSTKLEKLMTAFCERQGKAISSVRFLFEGQRVQPTDTPDTLEMADGDTLEVHQEQVGGSN